MKRVNCCFFFFLSLLLAASSCLAEERSVLVRLETPIIIEKQTKNVICRFADITPEAMKWGFDKIRMFGVTRFEKIPKGTRVFIDWTSIEDEKGKREVLASQLHSRIATSGERIDSGEVFSATGNLNALLELLKKLKETKEEEEKQLTKPEEEENTEVSSLVPQSGGSGGGSSGAMGDYSGSSDGIKADVQTTSYKECPDFINLGKMTIFEQNKKIVSGESGTTYSEGVCQNTGKTYPIRTTKDDCTIEVDFESGKAYVTEKYYYQKGTSQIYVGDMCRRSQKAYALYETYNTCTDVVDKTNGKVFPQHRMAYKVGSKEEYVSPCSPTSQEVPIQDEICTPRFEHDFNNGVSYEHRRKYYTFDGKKTYISECGRYTGKSYKHYEEDAEEWKRDPKTNAGILQSRTYIEDDDGSKIYIRDYHDRLVVPYTFEDCPDFVDVVNTKVFSQHREVLRGESGILYAQGICENTGKSYPIMRTYDGCGINADFEAMLAFETDRTYYMKDGQQLFIDNACKKNGTSFPIYETRNTCTVAVDIPNKQAIPSYRLAYQDKIEEYLTECAPKDGAPLPLETEICSPRFDHDLANGVSYELERLYYSLGGKKFYVSDCTRNIKKTFQHIEEEFGWTMDDAKLTGTLTARKYITDTDGSKIYVTEAYDKKTLAYTIKSSKTQNVFFAKTTTWTPPQKGMYEITLVAGGSNGGNVRCRSGEGWTGYRGGGAHGGSPYSSGDGRQLSAAGGGGAGGEAVTKTLELTASPIKITIGGSNQNSTFGSHFTARTGYGASGGNGSFSGNYRDYGGNGYLKGGRGGAGTYFTPNAVGFSSSTSGGSSHFDNVHYGTMHPTLGAGGANYGGGGGGALCWGGAMGMDRLTASGGRGASGAANITWSEITYNRPDGTTYKP